MLPNNGHATHTDLSFHSQRHRLVKGCENKSNEAAAADDSTQDRAGEGDDDRSSMGKEA